MRICPLIAISIALLSSVSLGAQSSAVHVQDGGTRERLVSIFIPPLAQAPFTLVLSTEWSRPLSSGGAFTLVNRRLIERDSQGRIYQERWLLVPKGGKVESQMTATEISDPAEHTRYNCGVAEKVCYLQAYGESAATAYTPEAGTAGPLANGNGFRTREDLGANVIEGVDTTGFRETTTINAGVYGNDRPMVTTREFWYAPKLGVNLLSKLDSPQAGKQTFTVRELSLAEPEPGRFAVPEGYSVVDERKNAAR